MGGLQLGKGERIPEGSSPGAELIQPMVPGAVSQVPCVGTQLTGSRSWYLWGGEDQPLLSPSRCLSSRPL